MPPEPVQSPFLTMSRVLRFWGAAIAVLLLVGFVRGYLPPTLGPLAWGTVSSIILWILIGLFLRTDGRRLEDAGLNWTPGSPLRFVGGIAAGLLVYALTIVLIGLTLGPIRLVSAPTPALGSVLLLVLGLIALAVMEELSFRSYSLWTAVRAIGPWAAQVLVAVAFSLLHIAYGWPVQTVLLGVFPSALLFGAAAVATGGLALPLGIHLGMNLGRWATGESNGNGLWTMDTSGLDPSAATTAPLLAALIPVITAVLLLVSLGRRRSPQ